MLKKLAQSNIFAKDSEDKLGRAIDLSIKVCFAGMLAGCLISGFAGALLLAL